MIKTEGENTTITCDKCGTSQTEPTQEYNDAFFQAGWALKNGRKYHHLCNRCLPKKLREAMNRSIAREAIMNQSKKR